MDMIDSCFVFLVFHSGSQKVSETIWLLLFCFVSASAWVKITLKVKDDG